MSRYIEEKKPKGKPEVEDVSDWDFAEEEDMPETQIHRWLAHYITQVLQWLFWGKRWAIYGNLNVYPIVLTTEKPIAPDVMAIKGFVTQDISSWNIALTGQAPHVVFEIASEQTWGRDVSEKPDEYAQMGVQEYFYYDPNEGAERKHAKRRLIGWRMDPITREPRKLVSDKLGRLWSEQLESYLVPDGTSLRFQDRLGNLLLTAEEAATQRAEAERLAKEVATQRAEAERLAKEVATQRAEAERLAKEMALQRAEVLARQLRALGITPDA